MAQFDAYRKWLGIPPEEQPPHHYRLLGIGLFESDADVISSAADRQMAHVRTFQTGRQAAVSQQILNELAAARLCLLDPDRKLHYDHELRQKLVALTPRVVPSPPPPRVVAPRPSAPGGSVPVSTTTVVSVPAGTLYNAAAQAAGNHAAPPVAVPLQPPAAMLPTAVPFSPPAAEAVEREPRLLDSGVFRPISRSKTRTTKHGPRRKDASWETLTIVVLLIAAAVGLGAWLLSINLSRTTPAVKHHGDRPRVDRPQNNRGNNNFGGNHAGNGANGGGGRLDAPTGVGGGMVDDGPRPIPPVIKGPPPQTEEFPDINVPAPAPKSPAPAAAPAAEKLAPGGPGTDEAPDDAVGKPMPEEKK